MSSNHQTAWEFRGYLREGPKHSLDEFYGYRNELNELINNAAAGRRSIVAVLGPRRIGKTSLILTAYTAAITQGVLKPDKTALIHADFRGIASKDAALHAILNGYRTAERMMRTKAVEKLKNALLEKLLTEEKETKEAGVNAFIFKGGISRTKVRKLIREGNLEGFRDTLELIDETCREEKLTCIVFLDELHEVMDKLKGVKNEIPQTLAYAHDHLANIKIVISGSRIRLTEDIIQHEELIQRTNEIRMKPLTPEESWELLTKAFTDHGVEYIPQALNEGYRISKGVAGWLTEYGRKYVLAYRIHRDPLKALNETIDRTIGAMKAACSEELMELKKRLKGSETYTAAHKILSYVAKGINQPSDLKRITNLSTGMLNHILKLLMKYDILTKTSEGRTVKYAISDPAILAHFQDLH